MICVFKISFLSIQKWCFHCTAQSDLRRRFHLWSETFYIGLIEIPTTICLVALHLRTQKNFPMCYSSLHLRTHSRCFPKTNTRIWTSHTMDPSRVAGQKDLLTVYEQLCASRADTFCPDNMSSHQLVTYCHSATLHELASAPKFNTENSHFSPLRTAAIQQTLQTRNIWRCKWSDWRRGSRQTTTCEWRKIVSFWVIHIESSSLIT